MKLKKVIFLSLLFLLFFGLTTYAAEDVEIDMENILTKFNNHKYVKQLNSNGNKIYAVERTNRYTLRNDTTELTYVYDPKDKTLHTQIETESSNRDDLELLNALFIDTLGAMQGFDEGSFIRTVLSGKYFSLDLDESGIEMSYQDTDFGEPCIDCKIKPSIKFKVFESNEPIPSSEFSKEYNSLFDDTDTFVFYEDMVVLKYTDDYGDVVIYVGEPNSNTDRSISSVKTLVGMLSTENVLRFFEAKVTSLEQDMETDGISIESDLDSLPVHDSRLVLLPSNMVYAKITLDMENLKQNAEKEPIIENVDNKTKKPSTITNRSVPLVSAIIVLGLAIIFILIGILKRRLDDR